MGLTARDREIARLKEEVSFWSGKAEQAEKDNEFLRTQIRNPEQREWAATMGERREEVARAKQRSMEWQNKAADSQALVTALRRQIKRLEAQGQAAAER